MKKVLLTLALLAVTLLVLANIPCPPCQQANEVTVSIPLEMPRGQAWQLLQDFSLAHNYVPGLEKTEIVSTQKNGIGAHREVHNVDGSFIEETIIEWDQGYGFVIRLHKGEQVMPPMKLAQFRYQLDDEADNRSRMTLTMSIKMPMGYVGLKLHQWFIQSIIRDNLVAVAAGIKLYYESGQAVVEVEREGMKEQVEIYGIDG